MEINTHVPFGATPITYPHVTKKENGYIHFVTTSDKLASVGDVIFDSFDKRTSDGFVEQFLQSKATVVEVVEQRPARGNHREGVSAIFQLLKYE